MVIEFVVDHSVGSTHIVQSDIVVHKTGEDVVLDNDIINIRGLDGRSTDRVDKLESRDRVVSAWLHCTGDDRTIAGRLDGLSDHQTLSLPDEIDSWGKQKGAGLVGGSAVSGVNKDSVTVSGGCHRVGQIVEGAGLSAGSVGPQ